MQLDNGRSQALGRVSELVASIDEGVRDWRAAAVSAVHRALLLCGATQERLDPRMWILVHLVVEDVDEGRYEVNSSVLWRVSHGLKRWTGVDAARASWIEQCAAAVRARGIGIRPQAAGSSSGAGEVVVTSRVFHEEVPGGIASRDWTVKPEVLRAWMSARDSAQCSSRDGEQGARAIRNEQSGRRRYEGDHGRGFFPPAVAGSTSVSLAQPHGVGGPTESDNTDPFALYRLRRVAEYEARGNPKSGRRRRRGR